MNVLNILWAFNIRPAKDSVTGQPIPVDINDSVDVSPCDAIFHSSQLTVHGIVHSTCSIAVPMRNNPTG